MSAAVSANPIIPFNINTSLRLAYRMGFMSGFGVTSPLASYVKAALDQITEPQKDMKAAMTALHRLQRLYIVHELGLERNEKVVELIKNEEKFPLWENYAALETSDENKNNLARLMYEGDTERRSPILLLVDDYSRDVSERVLERINQEKDEVDVWISDAHMTRTIVAHADQDIAARYGQLLAARQSYVQRNIMLRSSDPSVPYYDADNIDNSKILAKAIFEQRLAAGTENQMYTLTVMPTPQDAAKDKIPYERYVDLFFNMCYVDWEKMDTCHKFLIAKLNAGSILRFANDDGTDLSMDITDALFANSRVAKNVPGSEVFSAPRRDSVNGKLVSKGRFSTELEPDKIIENITLQFENGKIVSYAAEIGQEYLANTIELDEGSHYIGEIGIGTNPNLTEHLINGLMVEKIGRSFHVAVGDTYTYTEYMGEKVAMDNGNRSNTHWDLTTMLYGKNGSMILDGEYIVKNGNFVHKELQYLNGMS